MKPTCFSSEKLMFSKRGPFRYKKESFYSSKGVLLPSKRNPFATQKDSFCFSAEFLLFFN